MPDRLAVTPDGLLAASAALHEHASQLVAADGAVSAGRRASSRGAANASEAIAAFSTAYAARVADRGQSAEAAAASYTSIDADGATDIGNVSV